MRVTRTHFDDAAGSGLISPAQAEQLWSFLLERGADTPSFRATHILYYLGGLTAIGAMTLFVTLGWERLGGWGLLATALAYAGAGVALTEYFLRRGNALIPAGLTAAFAVALTPLAVYGAQVALGAWPEGRVYREYHTLIDWRWLMMELATLACGAVMLWRYRLPFLVMPLAVTLWYLSMDLTPFLYGDAAASWEQRQWVSLWVGLAMIALAVAVDLRRRPEGDHAFWLHLFGVLAFWGGLSLMKSDSELGKFGYLCINLVMIAAGAVLSRRVYAVFGGLGVAGYLGHLAYHVFRDSLLFPFALTLIGLGVVALGLLWQRHEGVIARRLRAALPTR